MTNDDIREVLYDYYMGDEEILNEIVMFENPSYSNAVIGITENNKLVYDYEKMIACLVKEDGMTEEEAVDFISYNTCRALPCIYNSPLIMHKLFAEGEVE